MPTIYATHADISRELKELFPQGFTEATSPTGSEVTEELARVTASLRVRVMHAIGAEPAAGDDAAQLVKRGVVAKVTAWVYRRLRTGYSLVETAELVKPYEDTYKEVLSEIKLMPDLYRAPTPQQRHVGSTH